MDTPSSDADFARCLNCERRMLNDERYCAACGQDNARKRLTMRSIVTGTLDVVLNLEWPLLRTIINCTWRPGWVAAEYVRGRRRTFTNPLKYCVLLAAFELLLLQLIGVDLTQLYVNQVPPDDPKLVQAQQTFIQVNEFMIEWLAAFTLLVLPALAAAMRLLSWRGQRNFIEHYVLCLYVYGQSYFFQALMVPFGVYESPIAAQAANIIPIALYAVGVVQFVEGRWWVNALKSIIAHVCFYVALLVASILATAVYLMTFV